jgi:poly(hydroxyalkanoate) granule-associated protein
MMVITQCVIFEFKHTPLGFPDRSNKMSNEKIPHDEQPFEHSLTDLARKVLLAGIGAVVLAQEEAEAFIQKLIEKGELTEKDGRGILKDFREKRRRKAKKEFIRVIESIVSKMDIPTKNDIQNINDKISEILRKIDDLESE